MCPDERDMGMSRSRELLDLLEARWRQEGAPVHLAPGANEDELDDAEGRLGFALPQEVRDRFGWHNGHDEDSVDPDVFMFPIRVFPGNLQESIDERAELLADQDRRRGAGDEDESGRSFQPTWLAITQPAKRTIVADCSDGAQDRRAPAPIHVVHHWGERPWDTVLMPSLTAMLEVWWQLSEAGIWAFNPDGSGDWVIQNEEIPADLRKTGLFS